MQRTDNERNRRRRLVDGSNGRRRPTADSAADLQRPGLKIIFYNSFGQSCHSVIFSRVRMDSDLHPTKDPGLLTLTALLHLATPADRYFNNHTQIYIYPASS